MTNLRLLLLLGIASLCLGVPTIAGAAEDDLCVPQANGVPGPGNDYPEWWDATVTNKEQRWTGASRRIGNPALSATPELASLRTIWDAGSRRLFVHLSVKADPEMNPAQDMAAFALTDPSGNRVLYFDISPLHDCDTVSCTGAGRAVSGLTPVRYAAPGGTAWGPLGAVNPTLGGAFEIEVQQPWVQVENIVGGGVDWDLKFALVLPVGPSGQVDPGVRIYGTSFVAFKGPGVLDPVLTFQYPLLCNPSTIGTCEVDHGAAGPTLPDAVPTAISEWPQIQTGGIGDCGGIELVRELVGSEHGAMMGVIPGTSMAYELPGRTLNAVSGSSLWAGFHNDTGAGLSTGSIEAEFRIANWGLTYADWDEATWDLVATTPLAGSVDDGAYAGASGQGSIKSAAYAAGGVPTNPHQCMHVRLSSTPGTGSTVNFKVDSVYRNMDFVPASVVQRPADVNLIGRPLGPGQTDHPVYLLVRTDNMPSPAICKKYQGDHAGCFSIDLRREPEAAWDRAPRYTVHGFVDSGRKVNLPDAPQTPILTPFSSYGFYVTHEGELQGWEHRLDGAQRVEPHENLYRLDVADGTIATVVNTIRAIDEDTRPCGSVQAPTSPGGGAVAPEAPAATPANDAQLGCSPRPVRAPCEAGRCPPHDPCTLVEGSKQTHPEFGAGANGGPPETSKGITCAACTPTKPTKPTGPAACLGVVLLLGVRRTRRRRA